MVRPLWVVLNYFAMRCALAAAVVGMPATSLFFTQWVAVGVWISSCLGIHSRPMADRADYLSAQLPTCRKLFLIVTGLLQQVRLQ